MFENGFSQEDYEKYLEISIRIGDKECEIMYDAIQLMPLLQETKKMVDMLWNNDAGWHVIDGERMQVNDLYEQANKIYITVLSNIFSVIEEKIHFKSTEEEELVIYYSAINIVLCNLAFDKRIECVNTYYSCIKDL